MMKKKLLHYLPVFITAGLFLLCMLSLHIYDRVGVPFATVSFSAEIPTTEEDELLEQKTILAADVSVSASGKVISLDYPDKRSRDFFEALSLKGRSLEDAFSIIAEEVPAMPMGTAFIGAYADEEKKDTEGLSDSLKKLMVTAKDGYGKSVFCTYGTYNDEAVRRAQSQQVALGKMAYSLYFSNKSEDIGHYVDVYSILETDPHDLAYYIRSLCEESEGKLTHDSFCADVSGITEYGEKYISMEEARTIAIANTTLWYGYTVDDLTYTGISFYLGSLSYSFIPPIDETPYVFFVNMQTGDTLIGD